MNDKLYSESEKEQEIALAIQGNNSIIFNMIKEQIDHLVTQRLIDFRKAIPSIAEVTSLNQQKSL